MRTFSNEIGWILHQRLSMTTVNLLARSSVRIKHIYCIFQQVTEKRTGNLFPKKTKHIYCIFRQVTKKRKGNLFPVLDYWQFKTFELHYRTLSCRSVRFFTGTAFPRFSRSALPKSAKKSPVMGLKLI